MTMPNDDPDATKSYRCKGTDVNGDNCGRRTKKATGFCYMHGTEIELLIQQSLLQCDNCTIGDCTKRGEAPNGVCFFELMDPKIRPENISEIVGNLVDSIEESTLIRRRLARQTAAHPYNSKLASAYVGVAKLNQEQSNRLIDIKGWAEKKVVEKQEARSKRMRDSLLAGVPDDIIEAVAEYDDNISDPDE